MDTLPANLTRGFSLLWKLFLLQAFLFFIPFNLLLGQTPNAWINEIHYDNISGDTGEGVEIVIENADDYDIGLFELTFYNQEGAQITQTEALAEDNLNNSEGAFDIYVVWRDPIRNEKAGIALSYDGDLIQFLSYGGSITAVDGAANGNSSIDIGVVQNGGTPVGHSLQLSGEGDQYPLFSWNPPSANTFGDLNTNQQLIPIDGPQAIQDLTVTHIAPDKATISWTKPLGLHGEDWSGVLLFASTDDPIDLDLENRDATEFGGNEEFGEGTPIDQSSTISKKISDGDGLIEVTGLDPNENYHFAAYTFLSISGGQNDQFSGNSNQLSVDPAVGEVSNLTATPLDGRVRLTWKNTMGDEGIWWDNILIVASENPINFVPEQKEYAGDAVFGSGSHVDNNEYVVYSGTGEQILVTGLENNQAYYFEAFVRYDAADDNHFWSDGIDINATPFENQKYWTGTGGNSSFFNPANWAPTGVPGLNHDVILNHAYVAESYEVDIPIQQEGLRINSLSIHSAPDKNILSLLSGAKEDQALLTLLDETEPLSLGVNAVLQNSMTGTGETISIPSGGISLNTSAAYIHKTNASHAYILDKINLEAGMIPGTIHFLNPTPSDYTISLGGRTFQNLILDGDNSITFRMTSGGSVTITENLEIREGIGLAFNQSTAELHLEGDLLLDGSLSLTNPLILSGTGTQVITATIDTPVQLDKLILDNPQGLQLDHDLQVTSSLSFVEGAIQTGDYTLTLNYAANPMIEIIGDPEMNKIQGSLQIIREVGTEAVQFARSGVLIGEGEEALGNVSVTRNTGPEAVITNEDNESIQRNWEIIPTNPLTTDRALTFSWEEGEDEGFDLAGMQVWKISDAEEGWIPVSEFQDGSSRSITAVVNSFSRFTISDENNPLPVHLLYFKASVKNQDALLEWSTASEDNNAGFEVEKSRDGKVFNTIATLPGAGFSSTKKTYSFVDVSFSTGSYYRLKQLDINGDFTHSPIRYLPFPFSQQAAITLYPNPLQEQIFLRTDNKEAVASLRLYDSQGKALYKGFPNSIGEAEKALINLQPTLPRGVYLLFIEQGIKLHKIRVLKE